MANIIIVDDDHSTEVLIEHLEYRNHNVKRFKSASDAFSGMDEISKADLVILDIIMPRPKEQSTIHGDLTTGMGILTGLRQLNATIPVLVFSATSDPNLISTLREMPHTSFLSKWNAGSLKEVVSQIERLSSDNPESNKPNCFIVHGHDETSKLGLKNFLQNTLKLPEPIILHEKPNLGRTIIEKFEAHAFSVDLVFVLLTPDDVTVNDSSPDDLKRRARQNVIFEMGFFLAKLGRTSGKVILLYKGPLELPSDITGLIYIDISNGIESAGEAIRKELSDVL